MGWILRNIDWILVVSGVVTSTMLVQALAPRFAFKFIFGEDSPGAVSALIGRSWGAMIFASGLMLIYAAYHPEARLPILLYSIAGKLGFVALVFVEPRFRNARALPMALGDLLIVVVLIWYLIAR